MNIAFIIVALNVYCAQSKTLTDDFVGSQLTDDHTIGTVGAIDDNPILFTDDGNGTNAKSVSITALINPSSRPSSQPSTKPRSLGPSRKPAKPSVSPVRFSLSSGNPTPSPSFMSTSPSFLPSAPSLSPTLYSANVVVSWIETGEITVYDDRFVMVQSVMRNFSKPHVFLSIPDDGGSAIGSGYQVSTRLKNIQLTPYGQVLFSARLQQPNDSWCNYTWWTPVTQPPQVLMYLIIEEGHRTGVTNIYGQRTELDVSSEYWSGHCPHFNQRHHWLKTFEALPRPGSIAQAQTYNDSRFITFREIDATANQIGVTLFIQLHGIDRKYNPRINDCVTGHYLDHYDNNHWRQAYTRTAEKYSILGYSISTDVNNVPLADQGYFDVDKFLRYETHEVDGITSDSRWLRFVWEYSQRPGVYGMVNSYIGGDEITVRGFNFTRFGFSVAAQEDQCNKQSVIHIEGEKMTFLVIGQEFKPTSRPTSAPTSRPTSVPTSKPTRRPTWKPTRRPTSCPLCATCDPTGQPTGRPTGSPTHEPTVAPTASPTVKPTRSPTVKPTVVPTTNPTNIPSNQPTSEPTNLPSTRPTYGPTTKPTARPSTLPSSSPTVAPTSRPSGRPTKVPTRSPTTKPSSNPTPRPTWSPTGQPTGQPTSSPSWCECLCTAPPTVLPTYVPSSKPTTKPSSHPSTGPTSKPSASPTTLPSSNTPSFWPTVEPSSQPTHNTSMPTFSPTYKPSVRPSTRNPTRPTKRPTSRPNLLPVTNAPFKFTSGSSDKPGSTRAPSKRLPTYQPWTGVTHGVNDPYYGYGVDLVLADNGAEE